MKKDPVNKQSAAVVVDPGLEEKIRLRAYELYEERGRGDGHDMDDWLRAEAELAPKTTRAAA